jgi:hypothetical protein
MLQIFPLRESGAGPEALAKGTILASARIELLSSNQQLVATV